VSAELEGRIRASLRAYAELVEEPEDVALPVRRRTSAVRRWRAPLLVAAAVAAAVSVPVWLGVSGSGGDSTVASGGGASTEQDAVGADEGAEVFRTPEDSPVDAAEAAPAFEVGVTVPFDLYTHCGVLGADLGGTWFAADAPLVDSGNPPPGWDNPYQSGTVTLLTEDTAVFTDDAGHELQLRAAPDQRPPPCD
jgi:hypothetical protein